MKRFFLLVPFLFSMGCSHHLPDFTTRLNSRLPTEGAPKAIGDYSLGCLQGAQTFTGAEKGIVLSQQKRGRYWGHPDLIDLLTRAGAEFDKLGKKLIIGDLSQSRGGPTLTGHSSHQTGLDVDIWFHILKKSDTPSFRLIETEEMKAVASLEQDQVHLIKLMTREPSVERIFINPKFKKYLCEQSRALKLNPEDLHKLRAWWGHDDHIHVRLRCPTDSPECLPQQAIPPGDGCGKDLDWWFMEEAKDNEDPSAEKLKEDYLSKVKRLPKQCAFYWE